MVLQRALGPSKPATLEPKALDRLRVFRRDLTHAQELRQIADNLIEKELGAPPRRSLGARRRGLAMIANRGGPQAERARRLSETLGKIEANLEQQAKDITSVVDDLIEEKLGARPKTAKARENALGNIRNRGGEVGEAAGLLGKELEEIESELAARKPGTTSKFSTTAKKTAGKVEEATAKATATTKTLATQGLVKAEEAAVKTEAKLGSRVLASAGRLGLSLLLPDPMDAIMLMVQFAGSYQEAWDIIEQRNTRRGIAFGIAAGMVGLDWEWVKQNLWRRFAEPDVATLVIEAVGLAERSFNDGLVRGHRYGAAYPLRMKNRILGETFTILAQEGYKTDEKGLFTIDTVGRVARVLMPIADDFLQQAAERKQAREKREEDRARKERKDSGCVGNKC
jgi:hypothetical protein